MNKQKGLALSQSKGFTIIELIVVIAIIAVLASIVLVNVTQYINKSKNASIKGNMASLMTNATQYFDNNSTLYGSNFIGSQSYTLGASAAASANGGTALTAFGSTTTQAWCACSVIYNTGSESGTFCVDSTGYKSVSGTACTTRCLSAAASACTS